MKMNYVFLLTVLSIATATAAKGLGNFENKVTISSVTSHPVYVEIRDSKLEGTYTLDSYDDLSFELESSEDGLDVTVHTPRCELCDTPAKEFSKRVKKGTSAAVYLDSKKSIFKIAL